MPQAGKRRRSLKDAIMGLKPGEAVIQGPSGTRKLGKDENVRDRKRRKRLLDRIRGGNG